jgi:peptidylprolyl isomerase
VIRSLAVALLSVFLLAGCSGNGLDDIKVTGGDKPHIAGVEKFTIDDTTTRVLRNGHGATVAKGDTVALNYLAVNGRTGKEFDSSYPAGHPVPFTITSQMLRGFVDGLVGQKVGTRLLVAMPPKDAFNRAMDQYGLAADDTIVFLFDIIAIDPGQASGTARKLPASVPQLSLKDGKPSAFTKSTQTSASATEGAYVLIQGEGAKVTKGQSITVHYVGQLYPDGKVFDSSWAKDPLTSPIGNGGLIKCWDQLIGQAVGSRVVLVCPASVGYGKAGKPPQIPGGATLIFAVDILGAL